MSASRRLGTGLNAVLIALFALGIAIVLTELARRHPLRLDLSADGLATLDDDTRAALALAADRDAAITITAFTAQAKDEEAWIRDRTIRDFLATLASASDRVETAIVDLDRDRLVAEQLGVDRYGTVVVRARGDRVDLSDRELFRARGPKGAREVQFIGEPAISAAIRQVVAGRTKTIVALSGHGERVMFDRGIGELEALAQVIGDQGWTVRTIDLLRDAPPGAAPTVPADAATVLIVGPTAPLAPTEVQALRDWLGAGGSIGLFVDVGVEPPDWVTALGIGLPDGIALDPKSYFPHLDRPVVRYGRHPITEALAAGDVSTVVSVARPIALTPRDGVSGATLLETSRSGWIERGTEQPPAYDPDHDGVGPVAVAVAATLGPPVTAAAARLVVVGDVDLVRDELLDDSPGNATFVVNLVRWLARTDQPLAPVGRPATIRRLELGASQLAVVRIVLVGGMPLATALLGAVVLLARRAR